MSGVVAEETQAVARRAGFDDLPPEVLLPIMMQLWDLEQLGNLTRASPMAYRLFNIRANEIMDPILDAGYTHVNIRVLVRTLAILRSGNLSLNSLKEFKLKITDVMMKCRNAAQLHLQFASNVFEPKTSIIVLRSILATHRRITRQALDLLDSSLQRAGALRPKLLAGSNIYSESSRELVQLLKEETKFVVTRDTGPPEWEEEQRVFRAFWRLQLVEDMKKCVSAGMLQHWSRSDRRCMKRADFRDLYSDWSPPHIYIHPEIRELETVALYLRELDQNKMQGAVSLSLQTKSTQQDTRCRKWSRPQPPSSQFPPLQSKLLTLRRANSGCFIYEHQIRSLSGPEIPFSLFARYGFAFWSVQRMIDLGVGSAQVPHRAYSPGKPSIPFQWISVLEHIPREWYE